MSTDVSKGFITQSTWICSLCDKAFRNLSANIIHMRRHTEEELYPCSQCDKAFIQKAHIVTHMKAHSWGETT